VSLHPAQYLAFVEDIFYCISGSHIEFGAQQCKPSCNRQCIFPDNFTGILVRDDAAREKLQEQVGDVGLIM